VGAFLVALALEPSGAPALFQSIRPLNAVGALGFGFLALATSVLHLGRPQYAFRALIGLRHSWLSREILAFGLFALLASLYAAANFVGAVSPRILQGLGAAVAVSGLAGVVCSVCVYAVTRRALWNGAATTVRFLLTTALLGIATFLTSLMLASIVGGSLSARELIALRGGTLCQLLMAVAAAKLVFEASLFRHLQSRTSTSLKRSARLMLGPLSNATLARFGCGILGGICMPAFLLGNLQRVPPPGDLQLALIVMLAFVACLIGELLERYLFFAAVAAPRMPGSL